MTGPVDPLNKSAPPASSCSPFHARAALRALLTLRLPLDTATVAVIDGCVMEGVRRPPNASETVRARRARLRRLLVRLDAQPAGRRDDALVRCDTLAKLVGLSRVERELFALATHDLFDRLASSSVPSAASSFAAATTVLATALAAPSDLVAAALAPEATLRRGGLLDLGEADGGVRFRVGPIGARWLSVDRSAEPMARVFQPDEPAEWTFADFGHVGPDAELLRDQLRAALAAKRGVRIAVCGPTGSGRRALVRAVTADLGATIWRLRAAESALSAEDLARLALVSVAREGGVILVVDDSSEPESPALDLSALDALAKPPTSTAAPSPKVEREALAPRVEVPLVFIVEHDEDTAAWDFPDDGPRVDIAFQLPPMPAEVRERALKRAAKLDAEPTPAWIKNAASRGVSIAIVASVTKALEAVGYADSTAVERHLAHLMGRQGTHATHTSGPRLASALPYDLKWICTDTLHRPPELTRYRSPEAVPTSIAPS